MEKINPRRGLKILGFGNQARSWAQNVKDSGWNIEVYLRSESPRKKMAKDLGLKIIDVQNLSHSDKETPLAMLIPDHEIKSFLTQNVLPIGQTLIYAHGLTPWKERLSETFPQYSHALMAPKIIGDQLRERYLEKLPMGACWHTTEKNLGLKEYLFELALGLGLTFGPFEASFEEEAKADLFSERSFLCSLLPFGIEQSFSMMVKKGVKPELAFMECFLEAKFIMDSLFAAGPMAFFEKISPMALWGSKIGRETLLNEKFQEGLESIWENLNNIEKDGTNISSMEIDSYRQSLQNYWKNHLFEPLMKEFHHGS
jgi:ketol-acid reductoisomerase